MKHSLCPTVWLLFPGRVVKGLGWEDRYEVSSLTRFTRVATMDRCLKECNYTLDAKWMLKASREPQIEGWKKYPRNNVRLFDITPRSHRIFSCAWHRRWSLSLPSFHKSKAFGILAFRGWAEGRSFVTWHNPLFHWRNVGVVEPWLELRQMDKTWRHFRYPRQPQRALCRNVGLVSGSEMERRVFSCLCFSTTRSSHQPTCW